MTTEWTAIIAVITALGSLAVAFSTRHKNRAEGDATIADTALAMVKEVRGEQEELKKENTALRAKLAMMEVRIECQERELATLRVGVTLLSQQVMGLGQVPIWTPVAHEREDK